MTEHIDNNRLYEDLRYRFEYISKFINFTNDDILLLNTLAPIALPLVPVVVDAVYRKLFQFDVTKHFFMLRNDGFGGELTDHQTLTLDSAQMTYRQDVLSVYLKRLLLQKQWTDDFLRYLSLIGKIHTNDNDSQLINVDYIHINATLSFIETHLIDIVCVTDSLDDKTKKDILMALNKVFRIQNDLFVLHYLQPLRKNRSSTSSHQHKTDKCVCS